MSKLTVRYISHIASFVDSVSTLLSLRRVDTTWYDAIMNYSEEAWLNQDILEMYIRSMFTRQLLSDVSIVKNLYYSFVSLANEYDLYNVNNTLSRENYEDFMTRHFWVPNYTPSDDSGVMTYIITPLEGEISEEPFELSHHSHLTRLPGFSINIFTFFSPPACYNNNKRFRINNNVTRVVRNSVSSYETCVPLDGNVSMDMTVVSNLMLIEISRKIGYIIDVMNDMTEPIPFECKPAPFDANLDDELWCILDNTDGFISGPFALSMYTNIQKFLIIDIYVSKESEGLILDNLVEGCYEKYVKANGRDGDWDDIDGDVIPKDYFDRRCEKTYIKTDEYGYEDFVSYLVNLHVLDDPMEAVENFDTNCTKIIYTPWDKFSRTDPSVLREVNTRKTTMKLDKNNFMYTTEKYVQFVRRGFNVRLVM